MEEIITITIVGSETICDLAVTIIGGTSTAHLAARNRILTVCLTIVILATVGLVMEGLF